MGKVKVLKDRSAMSALERDVLDTLDKAGVLEDGGPGVVKAATVALNGEPVASFSTASTLAEVVASTVDEITRFMPRLKASEDEYADAAEFAKTTKKSMEGNHLHLSMLCRRLADAKNGKYQPGLPFGSDAPVDQGATQSVTALCSYGLTEKAADVLVEHDIKSIGDLESRMREDEWWHQKIKGFGGTRVDKLIDALTAFRGDNPVPSEEETSDAD